MSWLVTFADIVLLKTDSYYMGHHSAFDLQVNGLPTSPTSYFSIIDKTETYLNDPGSEQHQHTFQDKRSFGSEAFILRDVGK